MTLTKPSDPHNASPAQAICFSQSREPVLGTWSQKFYNSTMFLGHPVGCGFWSPLPYLFPFVHKLSEYVIHRNLFPQSSAERLYGLSEVAEPVNGKAKIQIRSNSFTSCALSIIPGYLGKGPRGT